MKLNICRILALALIVTMAVSLFPAAGFASPVTEEAEAAAETVTEKATEEPLPEPTPKLTSKSTPEPTEEPLPEATALPPAEPADPTQTPGGEPEETPPPWLEETDVSLFTPDPADSPTLPEPAKHEYLTFQSIEGGLAVVGCDLTREIVTVPGEWDGQPVLVIAAQAFSDCAKLREVSLPASLTEIAKDAFEGCPLLEKIAAPYLPEGNYAAEFATAWLAARPANAKAPEISAPPLHSQKASAATSGYVDQTISASLQDERVGPLTLEQGKAAVFLFEGAGRTSKTSVRQNALCVVVKNVDNRPTIVFEDNYCTTVPDYPKDTDFNDGRDMPIVRDGTYNLVTVNHKGYPALEVTTQAVDGNVPVVRFNEEKAADGRISNCRDIYIHHRAVNGLGEGYANSTGCFLIGPIAQENEAYVRFLRAVGVIGPEGNLDTPLEETGVPMGVVIVDRKSAVRYLDKLYGQKGREKILGEK